MNLISVVIYMLIDMFIVIVTYYGAWFLRFYTTFGVCRSPIPKEIFREVNHPIWLLLFTHIIAFSIFPLYRNIRIRKLSYLFLMVVLAISMQLTLIGSYFYFTKRYFPPSVIVVYGGVITVLMLCWRSFLTNDGIVVYKRLAKTIWYFIKKPSIGFITDFILLLIWYFIKKPGIGFITDFILLLITCAILLIIKLDMFIEIISGWAFIFLIIGIIIELVRFKIREKS